MMIHQEVQKEEVDPDHPPPTVVLAVEVVVLGVVRPHGPGVPALVDHQTVTGPLRRLKRQSVRHQNLLKDGREAQHLDQPKSTSDS